MDIRRRVELVATAYADELSLRALAEIATITADQNVRIIGGQMASLLLTAFPVPGTASRRDAVVHLHELARRTRRPLSGGDVPPARLATLIASLVGRPA
ncbi:hypothetical protein [Protofrankia coriariae]|uniref:DUF222 domain-containing protein n=1 Tax=Protofrankia coriariae TaxID=1562887 RepID=A0ABR5F7K2_9ACTN|nr:hypothetical protein [Protofrankia coriariae]KLL12711.1 hypothetical protein FrCorBMG51_03410 [Protofrankia coriariae]